MYCICNVLKKIYNYIAHCKTDIIPKVITVMLFI